MPIANWESSRIEDLDIPGGYRTIIAGAGISTIGELVAFVSEHPLSDLSGIAAGSRGEEELRKGIEDFMGQATDGAYEFGQKVNGVRRAAPTRRLTRAILVQNADPTA